MRINFNLPHNYFKAKPLFTKEGMQERNKIFVQTVYAAAEGDIDELKELYLKNREEVSKTLTFFDNMGVNPVGAAIHAGNTDMLLLMREMLQEKETELKERIEGNPRLSNNSAYMSDLNSTKACMERINKSLSD